MLSVALRDNAGAKLPCDP